LKRSRTNKKNYQEQQQQPNQDKKVLMCHEKDPHPYNAIHHKDELDAAEALANLAFNCRRRILESSIPVHS